MKMIISAGGTGGHILPALAVARELCRRGNWEINWLGSKGMESALLLKEGFHFYPLAIVALRGKGWIRSICYPFILCRALFQAFILLLRLHPEALLVTGGYVGFPAAMAARVLGKPLFVQEQNIYWGMATRLMSRLATKIYLGFPQQNSYNNAKMVCYGNPTPMEARIAKEQLLSPRARYEKRSGPLRLFITGGSQGALVFNQIIPQVLKRLPSDDFTVYHQCGAGWLKETRNQYAKVKCEVRLTEFIRDMSEPYLWADLVIARAGGLTLAEISLIGVASWLVPFPFAVDDHQSLNASFFAERGAAEYLHQDDFTIATLFKKLSSLSGGVQGGARRFLLKIATNAHLLATPNASRKIVDDIIKELKCA